MGACSDPEAEVDEWEPPPPVFASSEVDSVIDADAGWPSSSSDARQRAGDDLFSMVERREPDLAGKITGMLLETGPESVAELLASSTLLYDAIAEARSVIGDDR
jgi:polyadenylate-binding protein